ncbi:MAG: hypothetical protein KJZ93_02765 [Caldilineaceae bacterium]|nr:hypothetical protein [Caldilineaceae bacterium]
MRVHRVTIAQTFIFPPLVLLLSITTALGLALWPARAQAHDVGGRVSGAAGHALSGLRFDEEQCGPGGYLIEGTDLCTHGSDAPPTDEELEYAQLALDGLAMSTTTVCTGDGASGKRVQVMYVRRSDRPDRYATSLNMIRKIALNVGLLFDASATLTGGRRLVHYVTTPDCEVDVLNVEIEAAGDDTLGNLVKALRTLGYDSPDRKYLVFMESDIYCGIATVVNDTRPGPENRSNHQAGYARVDRTCWNEVAAAHELVHTLGGIQHTAPNASGGWHCIDNYDIMCYSDPPYFPTVSVLCDDTHYGSLLDCNNDDYFHTSPPATSYLATHWNVADSQFLINFDHLGADAGISLTITETMGSEYQIVLQVSGGAVVSDLIDHVEFYVDNQLVAALTEGPYTQSWLPPDPGVYWIEARVFMGEGTRVFQELRVTVSEDDDVEHAVYLPLIRLGQT